MDVTRIDEAADKEWMLSTVTSDGELISDAVDLSIISGFEEDPVEGEPDLVVELIELYLADVPTKLKAMQEFLLSENANALRDVAHNVKGSSSSIGAFQLAALCGELEVAANDHLISTLISLLSRIEHEFYRVQWAFTSERQRRLS